MVDGLVLFGLASTWLKDCFSIPRIDLGSPVFAFEFLLLGPG
jgi:hypothetical protein